MSEPAALPTGPQFDLQIVDAQAEAYAAVPTMAFRLRATESTGAAVHAVALRAQIRIEPQRRRYLHAEEERLFELFGETPRWGETLRPFLWAQVSTMIPSFTGEIETELLMPCTYDFEVSGTKYLYGLEQGDIPLVFFWSGTAFGRGENGFLTAPIPWHLESRYQLPVKVWRDVMDLYFPDSVWMRLSRETMDALQRYRVERALPGWDQTIETLLGEHGSKPGGSAGGSE